ncbi:polysaccharide biosynthesis tyrosine autokinase [Pseudacidovorax intermedius]|uniref:Putative tyrosine-protein kinase EpsB n=1 Tax=Pseudacidovorax intermedius TaxID=433924 RepID=A0A370FL52_9BURK|nr:polysaccharide biosynthesis tyrosine autokinase [Pseudacidovorax intermedius]RDI27109.1 tyrosine-protein kinase Etk/Wzc [Pseudacidovorax intermedius]
MQTPPAPAASLENDDDEIHLAEYFDILVDNKWLVAGITALALIVGAAYALLATPIYRSNLLIQVEDAAPDAKSVLGDVSSLFEVKTPATGEIQVLRSRLVVGGAVDAARFYIDAKPAYVPLVGEWLSRRAGSLSTPMTLPGLAGRVYGTEKIEVSRFDVPGGLEDQAPFVVTAMGDGRYEVEHPLLDAPFEGRVGQEITHNVPGAAGAIVLKIDRLDALPGAQFNVSRYSRLRTIEDLQRNIQASEQGRQSNVISVELEDSNRTRLTAILNALGTKYVDQNRERKAAEAERTLSFLDEQLPEFKRQLERSEDAYTRFRNQNSTVAFDEEAKAALSQIVDLQTKLLDAQQKRREFIALFTPNHPRVQTIDQQIGLIQRNIDAINSRVSRMPTIQQEAFRYERDVRVNSELYQSLLTNSLQLRLVKEGKTGNVRLLDSAISPRLPVKPQKALVVALAGVLGLLAGVAVAFVRSMFFSGIRNPQEIESHTGMSVMSVIPYTQEQGVLEVRMESSQKGVHVLTVTNPESTTVESVRSLRIALQFAMLEGANNRVLITGPTPGIGKSFVSANFAAIMAAAGKRVLLLDADMRKGYINKQFGLAREGGLSELLVGEVTLEQAIHRQVVPNLDVLTSGRYPPNPADMLMSDTFARLLDTLSAQYDLVVMDAPPVLVAADAAAAGAHSAVVLLVARADQTQMGELVESVKRLRQGNVTPTGVVFNAMDMTRRHYGSYGYRYGGYRYTEYKYKR